MLWILARLYETLPEVGDLPKPKLCSFFDEAHLLFQDASQALLDEIERTARLIRSKGVGVYFVTHAPTDVPNTVLAQLGNRVEHALRAFTPDDADALRKTARTFPTTDFYDVEKLLTSLGIGEAAVTVLSPRGVPTPLAATRLAAPDSSMTPLDDVQFQGRIATSPFHAKYGTTVDRDSAYERITARLAAARAAAEAEAQAAAQTQAAGAGGGGAGGGYGGGAGGAGGGYAAPRVPGDFGTMTPAEQRREIERRAREIDEQRRYENRRRREDRAEQRRTERARQRTINTAIRTTGRLASSRLGQDILRGIFKTIRGG
jgi:DNA helicase HerA-like ATPase